MKLLIADDHTLFRDALMQYVSRAEPDAEVVLAQDFYETAEVLKSDSEFNLVILDLRMPSMNGMDGVKLLRKNYPKISIGIMSGVAETEDIQEALEIGVVGYFPKTLSGKALIRAIQTVVHGNTFIPYEKSSRHIQPAYYDDGFRKQQAVVDGINDMTQERMDMTDFNLTPRERDVLFYLVTGQSNKEIANALSLQVVTVKLHVRGICKKLGAKNRTQAALIARENRIVLKEPESKDKSQNV